MEAVRKHKLFSVTKNLISNTISKEICEARDLKRLKRLQTALISHHEIIY